MSDEPQNQDSEQNSVAESSQGTTTPISQDTTVSDPSITSSEPLNPPINVRYPWFWLKNDHLANPRRNCPKDSRED